MHPSAMRKKSFHAPDEGINRKSKEDGGSAFPSHMRELRSLERCRTETGVRIVCGCLRHTSSWCKFRIYKESGWKSTLS